MDDYLTKPFAIEQMREVLARWLPQGSKSVEAATAPRRRDETRSRPPGERTRDWAEVLERRALDNIRTLQRDGDESVLRKFVRVYLETSTDLLTRLRHGLADGDADEINHVAHTLKSCSANMGAKRLASLCKQLEVVGQDSELDPAAELLAGIEREFEVVRQALADACEHEAA